MDLKLKTWRTLIVPVLVGAYIVIIGKFSGAPMQEVGQLAEMVGIVVFTIAFLIGEVGEGRPMNSTESKLYGCLGVVWVILIIALGVLKFLQSAMQSAVAWHTADTTVAIAKLQAQSTITVGCMQNSWFTSMKDCISYGGVNGVLGVSWNEMAVILVAAIVVTVYSMKAKAK